MIIEISAIITIVLLSGIVFEYQRTNKNKIPFSWRMKEKKD